ncbi:MAG: endopeptidase La [Bacilli bacterium]|nr:endopeptidase La [Bacilli bacterium]
MTKTSLPVLLIRNMVLFPWSEIRLEFDSDNDKKVISLAESFYENNIVIVNPKDLLEIDPDISELPKIGVLATIKMKIDMPNGKTRIILSGINRVYVHAYTKDDNLFEAMVSDTEEDELDIKEELAYSRALNKHIEVYVKEVPYMSNSVLGQIAGITSISRLTDIIALFLPTTFERKKEYIEEVSSTSRVKMILDDINRDIEVMKLEEEIEREVTKKMDESQKEYVLREKIKAIKEELGDINDKDTDIDLLKDKIRKLNCPKKIREKLEYEISRYEMCSSLSPEVGIIRNYIDWLINLPWDNFTKDETNLVKVKKYLDSTHFGLDKAKERIIEYLAVKQKTNNLKSPILCFVGPPGVGKTTLAKSIAKSIGRETTKISVGGINDEAEIVGHRRTYLGANPGLIIQGMKKAGTTNPVFIIDEIDKMTKDIKGDPASSLLEVLDPEQNNKFIDLFIEEEFDLSNVMFITTANYIEQIPNELRDRLEIIELYSYTEYEKLDIAKKHLIPKEITEHGLTSKNVRFTDDAILTIIRGYTKEAGVRELDRVIATVIRKIVKDIVMNNTKSNCIINNGNIKKYLGNKKYLDNNDKELLSAGVVNGLAYTPYGGDLLQVEVTYFSGTGNLVLTGSLGDVMKESATIALSYIKANAKTFKLDDKIFRENDFHIHVPEGAIPKEGPSAGVTLTTAILSSLLNKKVSSNVAMTGEVTLTGKVLPIGGLKEKSIAAFRSGIERVFIPKENEPDLEEIPKEIKNKIDFILVDDYIQIFKKVW